MRFPLVLLTALSMAGACQDIDDPALNNEAKADQIADLRPRIGSVFQIEHFHVEVSPTVKKYIKQNPPGSVLFWNANSADAVTIREVVREYSEAAATAGSPPILFSTDYEGGALRWTPSWNNISGVQRFRKGFTSLVHARWLGVAYKKDPELGRELGFLHGQILAQELTSVGINYPLATISDLASGLFAARGIDRNPEIVSDVMFSVFKGAMTEPTIAFVTKHFPGLGQTRGDTHDNVVVSPVLNNADSEKHLGTFRSAVDKMKALGEEKRLSVMCSHAKFPFYDADKNTTTSPIMLQSLLRDEVGFGGIALSDAMWMGPYGSYGTTDLHRIYMESFLAGMDMLMIPGGKYGKARKYFESFLDQTLSSAEKTMWEQRLSTDWPALHAHFLQRLAQSVARIDATANTLGYAHEVLDEAGVVPSDTTAELRKRYHEILIEVDPTWATKL